MPNLARLRGRGATARGSLTTMPSKTAPGHAALYTGAWSDRNGITGNEVVMPGAAITDGSSGYSSLRLTAEPIWAAAARQDLDVTVVSATQTYPFSTYLADHRFPGYYGRHLTMFDGYQSLEARDRVYGASDLHAATLEWLGPLPEHAGEARAFALEDLGVRFDALLYDDPRDPATGFDTLLLTLDGDPKGGITLKPQPGARRTPPPSEGWRSPSPEAMLPCTSVSSPWRPTRPPSPSTARRRTSSARPSRAWSRPRWTRAEASWATAPP
jgi:hypothetical protein